MVVNIILESKYTDNKGHYSTKGKYEGLDGDNKFEYKGAKDKMEQREVEGIFTMLVDDNDDKKDEMLYF